MINIIKSFKNLVNYEMNVDNVMKFDIIMSDVFVLCIYRIYKYDGWMMWLFSF